MASFGTYRRKTTKKSKLLALALKIVHYLVLQTSSTSLTLLFTKLYISLLSFQYSLLSVSGPLHKPFPLLECLFPGSSSGFTQLRPQVSVKKKIPPLSPPSLIILYLSMLFISFVFFFFFFFFNASLWRR